MKKYLEVFCAVLCVIFLQSCSEVEPEYYGDAEEGRDFDIIINQVDSERIFELVLKSKVGDNLCVGIDSWPNSNGLVADGRAALQIGGITRSAPVINLGFNLFDISVLIIYPNESIKGYIKYEMFGEPDEIAKINDKKLIYIIKPFFCKRKYKIFGIEFNDEWSRS